MQNSRLKKELLGQHKEVSAKELELYRQGKLSAQKAREVELKLSANEFSSMAADGLNTYGEGVSVSDLANSYKTKSYAKWYYGALLISVVCAALLFWPDSAENENHSVAQTIEKHSIQQPRTIETPSITDQTKEVKQSEPTPKTTEINDSQPTLPGEKSTPTVSLNQSEESNLPTLFSAEIEREIFKPEPMETKTFSALSTEDVPKPSTKTVLLRHYKNYKLVDQGFGLDEAQLVPILNGTPAFSEVIYQRPEYPEWMSADSIYKLTVNKCIDLIISEKYTDAQLKLERLLELEPSDLTAMFYLGYSLYLKEDYESAITYFNMTETHVIQTFDHDARFMEIKCLMALNRISEAQKEVDYLVKSESFYAEKAKELVN